MKKPNNHPTKAESPHVAKHGVGLIQPGFSSPLSSNNPKPRKDTVFFTNGNGVITTAPCNLAGREKGVGGNSKLSDTLGGKVCHPPPTPLHLKGETSESPEGLARETHNSLSKISPPELGACLLSLAPILGSIPKKHTFVLRFPGNRIRKFQFAGSHQIGKNEIETHFTEVFDYEEKKYKKRIL